MILLVLVVILWLLVLAPSLYRRFSERDSVGSIDHFHHELNLLVHAGPKLVSPAYRLHSAVPGGSVGSHFGPPSRSSGAASAARIVSSSTQEVTSRLCQASPSKPQAEV